MQALEYADGAGTVRLKELGLTLEDLEFALRGADAEARTWSAAAPPIMPGLARWGKTAELLRLRLLPRGWSQDNPRGLPRAIGPGPGPGREVAIVATAGDAATGLPKANPANRYPKGIETMKAVERNVQLAFDFSDLFGEAGPDDDVLATWLLLYNVTPTEIRAELSLPSDITPTGFVSAWQERILLPVIDLTSPDVTGRGLPERGENRDVTVAVEQR